MEFRTINDLNNLIQKNIYKIQGKYDLIVGVPRSGMLPATLISLYLNLPMTDFDSLLNDKIYSLGNTKKKNWIKNINEARRILIVEDSSATGNSIQEVKEKLKKFEYKNKCDVLAIYVTEEVKNNVDLYFEICSLPRLFEWNYLHHKGIKNACYDIDGVLCEDPTKDENDDGEEYIKFLLNAKPKFIPTFEIGYIVTSRLEKYRNETETWLKNNNIKYKKLIMLDLPNQEERKKRNCHGKFKGEIYKKLKDASIFIESEQNQAREIREISGKPVYCTENKYFFDESTGKKKAKNAKKKLKKIIKKILHIERRK